MMHPDATIPLYEQIKADLQFDDVTMIVLNITKEDIDEALERLRLIGMDKQMAYEIVRKMWNNSRQV